MKTLDLFEDTQLTVNELISIRGGDGEGEGDTIIIPD
jgi:hypothetical protein